MWRTGSPPVFNPATAAVFNNLFETDASQRTVANDDSVPTMLPLGMGEMNYTFVRDYADWLEISLIVFEFS